MMKSTLALLVGVAFSGCLDVFAADPVPSGACREGDGLFVRGQHHPGFIGPEYQWMFYTLERDGRLTYVRANESASGTGKVTLAGRLHNVTVQDVKQTLRTFGQYSTSKDYQVSIGWRHTVSASGFDAFCGVVLEEFYGYKPRYEERGIADCDAFTFTIQTHKGIHASYSYCQAGPGDVRHAFDALRDEAWKRFGIEGL